MPLTPAIAAALAAKTPSDVAQACLAHFQSELVVAKTAVNYWSRRRAGQVNNCLSDQEHAKEAWEDMLRLEKVVRNLEKVLGQNQTTTTTGEQS